MSFIKDYNKFKNQQKNKLFSEKLFRWKTREEINLLYEEGYSPQQLAKLFNHEIGFSCFCNIQSFYGETKNVFTVFHRMSTSIFARRLKQNVPYSKSMLFFHLKQPQWWKIRFDHLDKTEDEVKLLAKTQLLNWQKDTCRKRKSSKAYTPQYTIDYWVDKSENPEKALLDYKNSISPKRIEFWIKKGFSSDDAKDKISIAARKGAIAACQSLRGRCVSKAEREIYSLLNASDNQIVHQKNLGIYCYDFAKISNKKIVEYNGTYWHADPRVYFDTDAQLLHGTVKEIREKDIEKANFVTSRGWKLLTVWELDYCKSRDSVIESILEFFK